MALLAVPTTETKLLNDIEEWMGLGPVQSVTVVPFGPSGLCYWNCDRYVEKYGGRTVYGWQLLGIPKLFLVMVHHAVVETVTGQLIDPTTLNGAPQGKIGVILDNSLIPSRDYPAYFPNRYLAYKGGAKALHRFREADEYELQVRRKIVQLGKNLGLKWHSGEGLKGVPLTNEYRKLDNELKVAKRMMAKAIKFCRSVQARIS